MILTITIHNSDKVDGLHRETYSPAKQIILNPSHWPVALKTGDLFQDIGSSSDGRSLGITLSIRQTQLLQTLLQSVTHNAQTDNVDGNHNCRHSMQPSNLQWKRRVPCSFLILLHTHILISGHREVHNFPSLLLTVNNSNIRTIMFHCCIVFDKSIPPYLNFPMSS